MHLVASSPRPGLALRSSPPLSKASFQNRVSLDLINVPQYRHCGFNPWACQNEPEDNEKPSHKKKPFKKKPARSVSGRYPTFLPQDPAKPYVIYKLTHKLKGKIYIGLTTDLDSRVRRHWHQPNHKMKGDVNAAKKADQTFTDVFEVTVLKTAFDKEHGEYVERLLSFQFGSTEPGNYGTCAGNPYNDDYFWRMKDAIARREFFSNRHLYSE